MTRLRKVEARMVELIRARASGLAGPNTRVEVEGNAGRVLLFGHPPSLRQRFARLGGASFRDRSRGAISAVM